MTIDLAPSTTVLADLVTTTADEALARPTPCAGLDVRGLLEHIGMFAAGFTGVARKEPRTPAPLADWRGELPARLTELAVAWADPAAWAGVTSAAGVEITGELAGHIALDETIVHSWDLAVATGRSFECDDAIVEALLPAITELAANPLRPDLFGPAVPVAPDAPALHRLLGVTGRDPNWSAA